MIWLVGNKGMLGTELGLALTRAALEWIGTDRELDFTDTDRVRTFAAEHRPQWIINCAAYTAVDRAEDEPALARRLNVEGPRILGTVGSEIGASVIHVSTDYVFDGLGITDPTGNRRPYREDDPAEPTGVYGRTKLDGERALMEACPASITLRTAWLYGAHGPNFVHTMLRLMSERESIGVVADQWGSPTWTHDLAQVIIAVMQSATPHYGIYHCSGEGLCTWHDFAGEIHRLARTHGILERDCTINALATDQYPTKVRRPAWSVLDNAKITRDYCVQMPEWRLSIERMITEIASQGRPTT